MATQTSVAVVAEKPSVARDIARVLNATKRGDGYLHGDGYVVTWAIGHLVALAQPHEIQPQWRSWRRDLLPMLPAVVAPRRRRKNQRPIRRCQKDPEFAESDRASSARRTPAGKAS